MVSKPGSMNSTIADEQIVEMYWQRDENAIRETEKKYGWMILRIAYNILHDPYDSEECRNDVYLRIWNSIPPNRPNELSLFIARIARNSAINVYKEKRKKTRVPSEMTESLEKLEAVLKEYRSPESEVSSREFDRLINVFIGTLSKRRRYVFIGRYFWADTLETIAKELGVNISTIQRDIKKIRHDLRDYLERNGEYV